MENIVKQAISVIWKKKNCRNLKFVKVIEMSSEEFR